MLFDNAPLAAAVRDLAGFIFEFRPMFSSPNHSPYHDAPHCSAASSCAPCMSIMQRTLVVSRRKKSKIQIFF